MRKTNRSEYISRHSDKILNLLDIFLKRLRFCVMSNLKNGKTDTHKIDSSKINFNTYVLFMRIFTRIALYNYKIIHSRILYDILAIYIK